MRGAPVIAYLRRWWHLRRLRAALAEDARQLELAVVRRRAELEEFRRREAVCPLHGIPDFEEDFPHEDDAA
jgi:C4-dicarboxylate-specific signal transduction histidine kinase